MIRVILLLTLVLIEIHSSHSQALTEAQITKLCEAFTITNCGECIKAHPDCAWCAATQTGSKIKRCRKLSNLVQSGECPPDQIENPKSKTLDTTSTTQQTQLHPQQIRVNLRSGDKIKFNITFKKTTDYPVDLYYLMDLSHSMENDLATLQRLGQSLANDIKNNVTQNIQMGFGTFVDKVMLPFASTVPEQLQNPCVKNQGNATCAPPFDFKHQQKITDRLELFRSSVDNTTISGNIDTPEGVFDALMQVAVCQNEIGWRPDASHLVVITTDGPFHMALDGKLAAILDANDMKCYLKKGANSYLPNDIVYSMSKKLDYPSIGQLRTAFANNKIQPIFAVTKEVRPLYEELKSLIPNSFVDELAADSSNIITIIKAAYNKLKEKLEMTLDDNKPAGINLSYRTLCPNTTDWKMNSLSCDQIRIGSEVVFEFEASASECGIDSTTPLTFSSSALQEDVKIYFNFLCSCPCSSLNTGVLSSNCSNQGSLSCGVCVCNPAYEGTLCQCTRNQTGVALSDSCKMSGASDDICEGNGQCECGKCVCNEGYLDTYCECSNKGCPANTDGVCGGNKKGTCRNCNGIATCTCNAAEGWTLDPNSGTCTCKEQLCIGNNNLTCSGNGNCTCNKCECTDPSLYIGEKCENCISPRCSPTTQTCNKRGTTVCAQCVNNAHRLRENIDVNCRVECEGIKYKLVTAIPDCTNCQRGSCPAICNNIDVSVFPPQDCSDQVSQSKCKLLFKIVWEQNDYLLLVKQFDQQQDCPQAIDPLLIILPIVAGIVVLGLICLIAWKIFQTLRDKREWINFENEMKQSKWTKGQNPIFEKPSTRFENPMFADNN